MSDHDYHIGAEADLNPSVNRQIWFYFLVLGVLLALMLAGLTIMYRFTLDEELTRKVGLVKSNEVVKYENESKLYLSGKKGVNEGKAHVAIDVAMKQLLNDMRKAP